jgi:hypothetical protein
MECQVWHDTGGAGTANQGYAGGNSATNTGDRRLGGGGGGANAVGANGTTGAAGNGGAGVATSITGSSVTYAGGGGGGAYSKILAGGTSSTGGAGGGGNGATTGGYTTGGNGRNCKHRRWRWWWYTILGRCWLATGGSGIVIARYSGLTQKAYGGTVTNDGSNTIHTFNSSGSFYTGAALATGGNTISFDGNNI